MILHGRNILLLADGTAIAAAKSCTLRVSANTIPIASPTSGAWEDAIPGRKSWQASCGQMVTGITDAAAIVGTVVTLRMQVAGELGLPFHGKVSNVTIQSGSVEEVEEVVWDTTNKKFLGVYYTQHFEENYYETWGKLAGVPNAASSNYVAGALYHYNQDVYRLTSTNLILEALQGSAIVTDWDVSAVVNNLAQGAFSFLGKGALAVPTT